MSVRARTQVDYPTTDGKPMGETETHRDQMLDLIGSLDWHFRDQPDVVATGNLLFFYEEGNRRRHVSPDVMVVFGVPKRVRDHYLLWEERVAPQVVIEITSKSTRREDMGTKMELYAQLGVEEYYAFDPYREYIDSRLAAWRLVDGQWRPIPVDGWLASPRLRLEFGIVEQKLRLRDPATGLLLATDREVREQAEQLRLRAEAAERELARLQQRVQEPDGR